MSNAEDYLDGLLSSINKAKSEVEIASEEAEASRRAKIEQRNHIQPDDDFMEVSGLKGYEPEEMPRTNLHRALTEDDFLRDFEEELESGEADAFIRAFEEEIDEEERLFMESVKPGNAASPAGSSSPSFDASVGEAEPSFGAAAAEPEPPLDSAVANPMAAGDLTAADISEHAADGAADSSDDMILPPEGELSGMDLVGALPGDEDYQPMEMEVPEMGGELPPDMEDFGDDAGQPEMERIPGLDEFAPDALDLEDGLEVPLMDDTGSDEDLMSLLQGQEGVDMAEISAMLQADEDHVELPESQENFESQIDDASMPTMDEDGDVSAADTAQPAGGAVSGLQGLLARLKGIFSKKGEDAPKVVEIKESKPENLSEENQEILKSLEVADKKAADKADKQKRKKAKKEKKEKEPKEKKPREKKPKKERPPREPDTSPVIPVKYIVIFAALAVSVIVLVNMGGSFLGYQRQISQAERFYGEGNYVEAFESLFGVEIKDADANMFPKMRMMADLQKCQRDYSNFMKMESYNYALDALIMGVGRYHEHMGDAKEYGISEEYQVLGQALEEQLKAQFGVSAEDAVGYYKLKKREDYTKVLQSILESLGLA